MAEFSRRKFLVATGACLGGALLQENGHARMVRLLQEGISRLLRPLRCER